MPNRHVYILLVSVILCTFCYFRADRYLNSFRYLMDMVETQALEPVHKRTLFDGALEGMLGTLDENSSYIPPVYYEEFDESLRQEFGGVGIGFQMDQASGRPTVSFTLPQSPAAKAGMKAGDQITAIGGQSTEGWGVEQVHALFRGPVGAMVVTDVFRPTTGETLHISIQRNRIRTESVEGIVRKPDGTWRYFLPAIPPEKIRSENAAGATADVETVESLAAAPQTVTEKLPATGEELPETKIAYLRISSFGEHTPVEMLRLLKMLQKQGMEGLILDVRDNSGGLLESAIKICNYFITKGVIVSTRGRDGVELRTVVADGSSALNHAVPMTILVNGHSASASEILAACLQDHARAGELTAVCVGTRTFGKGTVQQLVELGPLPNDHRFDVFSADGERPQAISLQDMWKRIWTEKAPRSAIRITIASYWRPSQKNIHRFANATPEDDWGVLPDEGLEVDVPRTAGGKITAAFSKAYTQYMTKRFHGSFTPEDWRTMYDVDPQLKIAVEWLMRVMPHNA